jgi:hypothetical protein
VASEYAALEHEAIQTLHSFLRSDVTDPAALNKAKVAQATLASVQSHNRTEAARNNLSFEMVRLLTNDPVKMAEYIRVTQPQHDPIQQVVTAQLVSGKAAE